VLRALPPPFHGPLSLVDLPRPRLDFSIVSQLDGLLFAMLGIRLERDVAARTAADSHCPFYGLQSFESCGSFVGLYTDHTCFMPAAVRTAAGHHACGMFIVPAYEVYADSIVTVDKVLGPLPWQQALARSAELTFPLPPDAFIPGPCVTSSPMVAVFASFHYTGRFKSKRRKEKSINLIVVPELRRPPSIGVIPVLVHRVSPLADALGPTAQADVAAASTTALGPFPVITARPPTWDLDVLRRWSSGYPDPRVVELALAAAGEGCDPFVGDISKPVGDHGLLAARRLSPEDTLLCRQRIIAEVANHRAAGPFSTEPFRSCRPCPSFSVPKKPHDPTNFDVRLINNFSSGGLTSVNELCWSPRFLAYHTSAAHIRDRIAFCGPRARVWAADIPSCFRRQRIPRRLWPLFVYIMNTPGFGLEYFVDLCNPFGWTPSEWGWQAILAILLWRARALQLDDLLAYVDNFWLFSPPTDDHDARCTAIESIFADANVDLHDRFHTPVFPALGWVWDIPNMLMVCPADKNSSVLRSFAEWTAVLDSPAPQFTLKALESMVGILQWLSAAFALGQADLSSIVMLKTKAKALYKSTRGKTSSVHVSDNAAYALRFWHEHFLTWDCTCPITSGFNPTVSYQILGRVDASTDWGCGGILYDGASLYYFLHAWTTAERVAAQAEARASTGHLEMLGACYWLHVFQGLTYGKRVQLELDSACAVAVLERGYSSNERMLAPLKIARVLCVRQHITLRTRHIYGLLFNKVADALSHENLPEARRHALNDFGLQLQLPPGLPTPLIGLDLQL
jgi:hypothetical protein